MSENKGIGSKFFGLFVESDDDAASEDAAKKGEKSAAELVAELAGQSAAPSRGTPGRSPMSPQGSSADLPSLRTDSMPTSAPPPTDFEGIFRDAGMDPSELDKVKKAEELLKSLPESTPTAVKRQIVEASLKAFGIELDLIVRGAMNQRRALDAYVRVNETATAKSLEEAEAQIRGLNEKIASLRSDIEKRTANLVAVTHAAQARKSQVQKVLEFFQSNPPAAPQA